MMMYAARSEIEALSWRITFEASGLLQATRSDTGASTIHQARISSYQIEERTRSVLPGALGDLLDLALAVYVSDRVCKRPSQKDSGGAEWERAFSIRVPVSRPELWNQPPVMEALTDALWFYTGDRWEFEFTQRPRDNEHYCQVELFQNTVTPTRAALFSGGLDSVAGLCIEALENPAERFLVVGGITGPRLQMLQSKVAAEICRYFKSRMDFSLLNFGLYQRASRADRRDEPSQRARGFVFATLGAVSAIMSGLDRLAIYENGIGAINLPHTRAQVGVHLTRAANPLALRRMDSLFKLVTGRSFTFELPFLFATKGQMCARLPREAFGPLLGRTVSCDCFPQRIAGYPQCGLCTSCLLRRVSLHGAGLTVVDTPNYRVDVLAPRWESPAVKLFPFHAMLFQVDRLREALAAADPWKALLLEFPELLELAHALSEDLPAVRPDERLVSLFAQYCSEWATFPARPPLAVRDLGGGA